MYKVFIDGRDGTTGLKIYDRLVSRDDISLIVLDDDKRKDSVHRKNALNSADVAFLCLPDDAARESVAMIENDTTCVIDASTAHRTAPGWCYGFPELSPEFHDKLTAAKRVSVPGCHASGFAALVYPLIKNGILPKDAKITCNSVTGYSGGGKKMISQYEDPERSHLFSAPRQYGLTQQHKHLAEMKYICGLQNTPIFCPIVADFYSGMVVTVPLFKSDLNSGYSINDIKELYSLQYTGPIMNYCVDINEDGFISANALRDNDFMQIFTEGNNDRILLIARFDNLGKGASGAAVQCMNIILGLDPAFGLVL